MCVCGVCFVLSHPVLSVSCDPIDCSLPGSSVHAFSRQEYWSGLPFPSPGDLPDPGIKPRSPALWADALPSEPLGKPKCTIKCDVLKPSRKPPLPRSREKLVFHRTGSWCQSLGAAELGYFSFDIRIDSSGLEYLLFQSCHDISSFTSSNNHRK